ncbi:MAG: EAL domain-containing protein [Xanthobacteraceae bacterium]
MKLHILQLPKLIAQRRSTAILGMIIIVMLWTGIIMKYFESVENDQREAERTNQNLAMLFEENVLRSIGEIDKALLYLRRIVESRGAEGGYETIYSLVESSDVLSEIIVQAAIVDNKGIIRWSNALLANAPAISVADRKHIKVQLNSTEDQLYISTPVVGRASGQWSVQFTRRFMRNDGIIGGVVVASLNPAHFTTFYDKFDLGSSGAVYMIGSDGIILSSGGNAVGRYSLSQDINGTKLAQHLKGEGATFEDTDPTTGESRLTTVRPVRGHPLWVSVGINKSDIFKRSAANLRLHAIAGIALTLLILAAMEQILRTEASARHKSEQLQLTLENMSQGIMLVTKDLQIPIINSRCGELLELPREFIEHPPRFDQLIEYQAQTADAVRATGSADQTKTRRADIGAEAQQFAISERKMPDGSVIEVRSGHLPDGSFVQTFTDITKRHEAEAHVARLASEDPLTGLPNRRVFRASLDDVSRRRASSRGGPKPPDYAVLFLDLDRFKVVNDTLGHRVGDLFLQAVAESLKTVLQNGELLARLGGDEFSIVVPSVESRTELEALANRLTDLVSQPYEIDGHRILSSVSIGIAVGPDDGDNSDDLLKAADLALYAVKASSRGTFRFYHRTMNEEVNDRRQIEMDLREAIEHEQLELHYQPIIDLQRNVITGFEALTRWRHPIKGQVPPSTFIPVAEDSGLILPLGAWSLREACRTAIKWPEHLRIAVNLSPVQFSAPNLYEIIATVLEETGLASNRLELEITERIFMDNSEKTLSTLHRLKQLGVCIAMDDFGTGYSSLSYLRSFPFDKIKVDRTFVSDLTDGTEHVVIVQAVVSIARALGMTTTAEGVETLGQKEFLAALGCNEGQGYLFSAAVPSEKLPELIAKWSAAKTMAA